MLSIPPYISTSWENVVSLHIDSSDSSQTLIIELKAGTKIKVPQLDTDLLNKIFKNHCHYLEEGDVEKKEPTKANPFASPFGMDNIATLGFPMKLGMNLEGLGNAMQHNPEQANAPDLPKEVLEKISAVAKIMDAEPQLTANLKAEPHCNCVHCQIARALHGETVHKEEEPNLDQEVTEEDLKFKTWDVKQSGDKLYTVSNPLDAEEQYSVYLGEPLGCTCGHKNCEHIKAVLST